MPRVVGVCSKRLDNKATGRDLNKGAVRSSSFVRFTSLRLGLGCTNGRTNRQKGLIRRVVGTNTVASNSVDTMYVVACGCAKTIGIRITTNQITDRPSTPAPPHTMIRS